MGRGLRLLPFQAELELADIDQPQKGVDTLQADVLAQHRNLVICDASHNLPSKALAVLVNG